MRNRFLLLLTVLVLVLGMLSACTASGSVDMGQGGTGAPANGADQGGTGAPANGADQGGNTGNTPAGASNTAAGTATITQEQAEQIALEHVGLTADQVTGLRVRYDMDDGIPEYDVEFYYDTFEYEFEIHAETGKILSFEKDD